jgi:uncharacterized membrane protein
MYLLLLSACMVITGFCETVQAESSPAKGNKEVGFRVCNETDNNVSLAIGHKQSDGWVTEGWWHLAPQSCETILKGDLTSRYIYLHARDLDEGDGWDGDAFLCTVGRPSFKIIGTETCTSRGYDRTGFREIDTGTMRAWTAPLTAGNKYKYQ